MSQFYAWLGSQMQREDEVGQYARSALTNICYPRTSRLLNLLKHEPDATRKALLRAHREWRKAHARMLEERS